MKKSVLLSVLFVLVLAGCSDGINGKFEPNLKSIKNFSNYSSLGVASKDIGASRSARSVEDNSADVLVGLNKYTEAIEELTYETSDDTEEKEELFVYSYTDTTPFLFVQFSRESMESNGSFVNISGLEESDFSPIYAISKKSGKIYSMEDIWFDNFISYDYLPSLYSVRPFSSMTYSKDCVFITKSNLNDENENYIYKISEEDELLKIEKYCEEKLLGEGIIISDDFGNLFGWDKYLTKEKQLKQWRDSRSGLFSIYQNYDGKIYTLIWNDEYWGYDYYYYDENGESNKIEFDLDNVYIFLFPSNELIYIEGLDYYYYHENYDNLKRTVCNYSYNDKYNCNAIYKISFADESKSKHIGVLVKNLGKNSVKIEKKIFYINSSEKMECYDIETKEEVLIDTGSGSITSIKREGDKLMYTTLETDYVTKNRGYVNIETLEVSTDMTKRSSKLSAIYLSPIN